MCTFDEEHTLLNGTFRQEHKTKENSHKLERWEGEFVRVIVLSGNVVIYICQYHFLVFLQIKTISYITQRDVKLCSIK